MKNNDIYPPSLVIPYHLGPSLRNFAIPLLYSEKLTTSMPGYFNPQVLEVFYDAGHRLADKQEPLLQTFIIVRHHFELSQKQAKKEAEYLKPLGSRIIRAAIAYSGTPDWYMKQASSRKPLLQAAAIAIAQNPQLMNVAATEFVWRLFEAFLEFKEDVNYACHHLQERAVALGDPMILLAECFLNRSSLIQKNTKLSFFTDDALITEMLKLAGSDLIDEKPNTIEIRTELLAYMIFECLLAGIAPRLLPPEVPKLATLMNAHSEELIRMRLHCQEEAAILINESPSEIHLQKTTKEALIRFEEEVSDIVNIKRSTIRKTINATLENYAFWAAIAGLVSSTLGGVDSTVSATLAATALSVFGANTVKMRRHQKEILLKSPWSFIYRLGPPVTPNVATFN